MYARKDIWRHVLRGGVVADLRQPVVRWASRFAGRLVVVTVFLAMCFAAVAAFGAGVSYASVGELGPPPGDSEIKQTLTEFYQAGHPADWVIAVQFVGPILVGQQPTMHPNPPPGPWCVPRPQPIQRGVRCGYPDQGSSLMYPVMALVSVTTTQGPVSSALPPTSFVHTTTMQYNGTACPGETNAQYCPTYYFYRDGQGRWHVA
jgi:hypothetical protein